MPLPFFERIDVGVPLLFFDKEWERSGTQKKWERLTHSSCLVVHWDVGKAKVLECRKNLDGLGFSGQAVGLDKSWVIFQISFQVAFLGRPPVCSSKICELVQCKWFSISSSNAAREQDILIFQISFLVAFLVRLPVCSSKICELDDRTPEKLGSIQGV